MIRTLLTGAAMVVATPLIAQTGAMPATPATPAAPADAAAGTPATAATPASPDATTAAAQPASTSDIVKIVDAEFPTYDMDKSGQLDKAEFTKWLTALKDQEMKATGKQMPANEVATWAAGAFATADADKSTTVTKAEVTKYLGG